jgi:large subunit ribosomal protein L17
MKHKVGGKRLSRDEKERKALYKNLACAFFLHDEIETTETKAKAMRGFVEKMITRARDGSLHSRRIINGILQDTEITNRLMDVIAPLYKDKNGGYVRVTRLWPRRGDNTMMAKISLVEKPVKVEIVKTGDKKDIKDTDDTKKMTKERKALKTKIKE